MGTNADHQRAWRQRQKAKLADLERQVLTIRRRRPRRAKPTTSEANDFIRKLLDFTGEYCIRADAWRKTNPPISADDREALMHRIHQCANELSELAQSFLPDLPDATPVEAERKRKAVKAVETVQARPSLAWKEWEEDPRELRAPARNDTYCISNISPHGFAITVFRRGPRGGKSYRQFEPVTTLKQAKALCERHYAQPYSMGGFKRL